ncbi:MAG: serpin B [archaeon GW2011_AR18]|nr:MAG: serpin B [archaeon GW2011_AR18]
MTYEGAKGQTAEEIQSLFYLPEDDELRRTSFEETNDEINKKDKEYSLHVANALWAQKDFEFRKDYFDLVEKYYGGSATNLDFYKDPESSRLVINDWVEEKTNDKIKDLIPHGAIKKITRLVLTNAIYFKGTWITQFDEEQTKDEDFKVGFGKTVKVPLMSIKENTFNYAETDDLQILELDYEGDELSMLFLLPDNMNSLEKSLTTEKLAEWKDMLRERRVDIYIPKFKFETKYFMAQDLVNMGMPTAFSDNADFTGMEDKPDEDLKIDQVIHQAFVEVNEEGTEAAAATAVIMVGITSVGHAPKIPIFRADHPFIFIIQQKETGNILFLGKVNDPNK